MRSGFGLFVLIPIVGSIAFWYSYIQIVQICVLPVRISNTRVLFYNTARENGEEFAGASGGQKLRRVEFRSALFLLGSFFHIFGVFRAPKFVHFKGCVTNVKILMEVTENAT